MVSGKRTIFSGHLMENRKPLPQPLSEGSAQKLGDQNMGPSRDYSLKLFRVTSSQPKRKLASISCWSEHDGC